jgi:hypothetical protein
VYLYGLAGIAFMALTVTAGWSVMSRLKIGLSTLEAMAASTVGARDHRAGILFVHVRLPAELL